MIFNSEDYLKNYLKGLIYLGQGGQGTCYLRKKDNMVLKIFHTPMYSEFDIMKFSNTKNDTFVWPTDIIKVNDTVVGYMLPYIPAKNLAAVNPFFVNLDKLENKIREAQKDIPIITEAGILTSDLTYNKLYKEKISVIDNLDYSLISDFDYDTILRKNKKQFDAEFYLFVVDRIFREVVFDDATLKELYLYKEENFLLFLKLLRNRLSELAGKRIEKLVDAKEYRDKVRVKKEYYRMLEQK